MSFVEEPRPMPLSDHSIVLDLDETLIHTMSDCYDEKGSLKIADNLGLFRNPKLSDITNRIFKTNLDDPTTPRGTGVKLTCWGIKRPHLVTFILFCFEYFRTVNIWSAGKRDYVQKIADDITRHMPYDFDVVYTYDDVEKKKGEIYKPLRKMVSNNPHIGPIENLIIVDDRKEIFSENVDNGVLIPAYSPLFSVTNLRMDDVNLMKLQEWLSRDDVRNAEHISNVPKSGIFKYTIEEIRNAKRVEDLV